ncbi:sensor histidine kinase [Pantanalinema rosaneae CENA516]|uniref:sensor histidine kinase n=1 Tax=Pantanalinema rosaneae TaxID=1620701 RepID=UPI003D6EF291
MKVGVPDLSTWNDSPPVGIRATKALKWSNPEQFCRLQLKQIAEALPAVYIQLVYRFPNCEQQQQLYWHSPSFIATAVLTKLASEDWLTEHIPSMQLSQLPLSREVSAYIYLFNQPATPLSELEYLLVCPCVPLSIAQQQLVEVQARHLHQYLMLFQECHAQRSRLEELEQTIQRTDHQLRKPLALIELYAELLTKQTTLMDEETRSQISLIYEATKELSQHLKHLTSCNQQAALRVDWCDLRSILATSLKGLQPWITEKQIQVHHPQTAAMLQVDAWQLKQAFDNLLSNAIHFSPNHSTIGCHWQVFRHEVVVEVWDEGPGLSEADLKQAFTPFYTRRPGGTGLGLAIVRKIILDHQGRLWVNNLPTKGAKFSFSLPRHSYPDPS